MRNAFFSLDGPIMGALNKAADLVILNLLFIITCIPVFTIGAALTALSCVTLKMKDGNEGYAWRTYLRSFKENFRQSTVIWVGLLVILMVLVTDYYVVRDMNGTAWMAIKVVVFAGLLLWLMMVMYVFPLQSRFYNPIRQTVRNALLLAISNAPRAICGAVVVVAAVVATFLNAYTITYGTLIWLLCGFAVLSMINSSLQIKLFRKLVAQVEEAEQNKDKESEDNTTVIPAEEK